MLDLLLSTGFQEKALLLLATASLSGLLIPYILKRVESRRTMEQKYREAQLARQAKIIDAQSDLLDSLARTLWDWRYSAMKVTYYGGQNDLELFEAARAAYANTVWALLSQTRFQASRAKWLISDDASHRILAFYSELIAIDLRLYEAAGLADSVKRSLELGDLNHQIFGRLTDEIDAILSGIAAQAMLSVQPETQPIMDRRRNGSHSGASVGVVRENESVAGLRGGEIRSGSHRGNRSTLPWLRL